MSEAAKNLDDWLKRVLNARSQKDVFEILNQFRVIDWTDEQRALMSHTYIRVLETTRNSAKNQESGAVEQQAADGPVWYEKM